MKKIPSVLIGLFAVALTGCGALGGDTKDDTITAQPEPVPVYTTNVTPADTAPAVTATTNARIDAKAFLKALVDSGCDIDNAEWKEVIRGGGIKVTCTKTDDLLDGPLENL